MIPFFPIVPECAFVNHSSLPQLSERELNKIDKWFKDHRYCKDVDIRKMFRYAFPHDEELNLDFLMIEEEIAQQYAADKALQGGVLREIAAAAYIGRCHGLTEFCKAEDHPLSYLYKTARYIVFSRLNPRKYIVHDGAPDKCDLLFVNETLQWRIEVKGSNAKAGEFDYGLTPGGGVVLSEKLLEKMPEMAEVFAWVVKNVDSVIAHGGHNISLPEDIAQILVRGYARMKHVDAVYSYTTRKDKRGMLIPTDDYFDMVSTKGSEFRTTGRNYASAVTLEHLKRILVSRYRCSVDEDGTIKIESRQLPEATKGRGMTTGRRIKFDNRYFVWSDTVRLINEQAEFAINKIKETKPTVSAHLKLLASPAKVNESLASKYGDLYCPVSATL